MTTLTLSARPRAALAALAALALAAAAPFETAAAHGGGGDEIVHQRARSTHRAGARRGRAFASRHGHRRVVVVDPGPPIGAAGIPAGYASDESPFNVQAEDNDFGTGAFYGCLHNVLTAGGYRPVATCD